VNGPTTGSVTGITNRRHASRSRARARRAPQGRATRRGGDDLAIWTDGLAKTYRGREAVGGIDLAVPRGALSGFVGPNGAGKTTTLRMLLGLIRPSSGRAQVLGAPIEQPAAYLPRLGAMIEGPTFHAGLSGRDNLRLLARLRGLDGGAVDEALDAVGLTERAAHGVRDYSLGMKQRLGIAAALLPRPDLLILDEPTNGLDPAGIREIRALLKDLAGAGMTVFVSSHLLGEVEQICDHLVMIRRGRLLFQGHVTELVAAADPRIVIAPERDADAGRLAEVLRGHGLAVEPEPASGGGRLAVHAPEGLAADLNRIAMTAGLALRELRVHRRSLEETFLRATGELDGEPGEGELKLEALAAGALAGAVADGEQADGARADDSGDGPRAQAPGGEAARAEAEPSFEMAPLTGPLPWLPVERVDAAPGRSNRPDRPDRSDRPDRLDRERSAAGAAPARPATPIVALPAPPAQRSATATADDGEWVWAPLTWEGHAHQYVVAEEFATPDIDLMGPAGALFGPWPDPPTATDGATDNSPADSGPTDNGPTDNSPTDGDDRPGEKPILDWHTGELPVVDWTTALRGWRNR